MTASFSLLRDISLLPFNTFGIDARAAALARIGSVEDLRSVLADAELASLPRQILGGGSNILLTRDFPGLVLLAVLRGIDVVGEDAQATFVRAAAGEGWHDFVLWTLRRGLGGLENLALIPGTVGAAPVQNIGAYGAELKDYFHSLTAYDFETGRTLTLAKDECDFGYRDSAFKHGLRDRMLILSVTFALPKDWRPNLSYADLAGEMTRRGITAPGARDICDAVTAVRHRKLTEPAVEGNAGSFFKNPTVSSATRAALLRTHPDMPSYPQPDGSCRLAAGWLIERCGWKGKSMGAAGVSATQALVLVNRGGATGADIVRLAEAVRTDVRQRFGILLEPEPVFV